LKKRHEGDIIWEAINLEPQFSIYDPMGRLEERDLFLKARMNFQIVAVGVLWKNSEQSCFQSFFFFS